MRFQSHDPFTGEAVWSGETGDVDVAMRAARAAFADWSGRSLEDRAAVLRAFATKVQAQRDAFVEAISRETGKPRWESQTEVDAIVTKIDLTIDAWQARHTMVEQAVGASQSVVLHKPLGIMGVLGPFNLPGHLPNGHIAPALLAGNTVVFKPSELTPWAGVLMVTAWRDAGLPAGTLQLVQGARTEGESLVNHPDLNGLAFTGSYPTGLALHKALAGRPDVLLALEMGGNNPLIVHQVNDLAAAAMVVCISAFITAGQRCTCARRLILIEGRETDALLDRVLTTMNTIRAGRYDDELPPFIGPLISRDAADKVLHAQNALIQRGGKPLMLIRRSDRSSALLLPGMLDVTDAKHRPDAEIFGPLLQVIRVRDFEAAIEEANRTKYGLAAGLLCDDRVLFEKYLQRSRAGVVNWNQQTTGASGRLPFGGVGCSGNHRPSGYFAVDYCCYPVASMQRDALATEKTPPGIGP